jgi:hypothetical protein
MIADQLRYGRWLDAIVAAYVEYRAVDVTKFNSFSDYEKAFIEAFNKSADFLTENRDHPDAQPIAELIDNVYFKTQKDSPLDLYDDIIPLSPNREYKIETELIKMPISSDVANVSTLFIEKFTAFIKSNPDNFSDEKTREVADEFLKTAENISEFEATEFMFGLFPYDDYEFIFEPLNASALPDYDKFGACLVGGYPHFTQSDDRPPEYSELLLQIDSFDYSDGYENTVMWGDGGVINFFIKPENLKNADFSDILVGGDCA